MKAKSRRCATPSRCEASLNFPRFALSDGTRLFVADSGNDRVLVYDEVPTENGAKADEVIGQPDFVALTDAVRPGQHARAHFAGAG